MNLAPLTNRFKQRDAKRAAQAAMGGGSST